MGETVSVETPDGVLRIASDERGALVSKRTKLILVIGYLLILATMVSLLWQARNWALTELATPEARDNWQVWREDVREARDPQAASVNRRVPGSSEPPALVLMRDYFATCVAAVVVFTTVLYAVVVWFAQGATGSANLQSDSSREKRTPGTWNDRKP